MCFSIKLLSQSFSADNLYIYSKQSINPAYAGENISPQFNFSYRKIATSLNGAPEAIYVDFSSKVYKNMSLGCHVYNKKEGLFNTNIGFIDYSYKIKLSRQKQLRFGLSTGINANKLSYGEILAEDPSAITNIAGKKFEELYFEGAAGIVFKSEKFEISLSSPKLFEAKNDFRLSMNYLMLYNFSLSDYKLEFKPGIFVNYTKDNPYLLDAFVYTSWNKRFQLGIGYKNRPAITASVGILLKGITLAYATEFSTGEYANMFGKTHQVSISYAFPKRQKTIKDTITTPVENYIANADSVSIDTTITENIVANDSTLKDTTTTESIITEENIKKEKIEEEIENTEFQITNASNGIYIITPILKDSSKQSHKTPEQLLSEQDSLLTLQLFEQIEEQEKGKKTLEEVGNGIYIVDSEFEDGIVLDEIQITQMVDSLIIEIEEEEKAQELVVNQTKNNNTEEIATNKEQDETETGEVVDKSDAIKKENELIKKVREKGGFYRKKYYTIRLIFNDTNKHLLKNPNIVDQARIEKSKKGSEKYYYGYFSTEEEALKQEKKLQNYKIKTKVLYFSSY